MNKSQGLFENPLFIFHILMSEFGLLILLICVCIFVLTFFNIKTNKNLCAALEALRRMPAPVIASPERETPPVPAPAPAPKTEPVPEPVPAPAPAPTPALETTELPAVTMKPAGDWMKS